MEDSAYKNALKRRAELRAELELVEKFLELYRKFAPVPKKEDIKVGSGRNALDTISYTGDDVSVRRSPPRGIIARKAREVILASGRPMTRTQLVRALDQADIPIAGEDRERNMGTIMWRLREEFVNIDGQGYWPKDVPNEKVGYSPNQT